MILGSVAVSKEGVRIGRGGGMLLFHLYFSILFFSLLILIEIYIGNVDLYLAVLNHLKLIQPHTTIMTTVHDSQVHFLFYLCVNINY